MGDAMSGLFDDTAPAAKGNARGSGYVRHQHDWYQESPRCVQSMLAAESFDGMAWDPACGGGNIPRVCQAHGISAVGSDLMDRGSGWPARDFLDMREAPAGVQHVICNPPFQLAQRFVEHALRLVPGKVAIVQRLAFLEGQARREFFERSGLSHVWIHSSRQSMPPGGVAMKADGGSVAYCWLVWRRTPPGQHWTGWFLP